MFNLFRSKGKAVKWMLGGLLFLVALSMLLYLVPNYTDPTQLAADPVILEVGDRKIKASEAQIGFQQYAQGKIPPELQSVYFPQYIEEIKMRYAALEQAQRLGITATNEEVADTLAQSGSWGPFFKDGKLTRRADFEAALAAQGGTPEELFDLVREELQLVKLRDVIAENTVVTPQELEEEYKRKYERATIDYITFHESDLRSKVQVTDEEIQKRYEANKAAYTRPEKYGFRVLVLSRDKVQENLQLSEQELRAEYSAALDNFRTPEQIHARHILLATDGKSDSEKNTIRAKAEDLIKKIKGGEDFAEVAKSNSEDAGNASLGGDLGTFARGSKDKDFEAAAFALKPNEVSGVVTSPYGYHIIQVLEKIPAVVTPFEVVRAELERELRESKAAEVMEQKSNQMHSEFAKNPGAAAEIAKKYDAELITVSEAGRGEAIPGLGVTPELDGLLPSMMPGAVTPAVTVPGDRVAMAVLDKKIPGRPSTLDEMRATLRDELLNEGARKLLDVRAKEAAERLKKGEDVQSVARATGGTADGASNFGVMDTIPNLGSAFFLKEAFDKGTGAVLGPMTVQGNTVVAKVVEKTAADMSALERERPTLLKELKTTRAQMNDRLWMDSIVRSLTDEGDLVVNQAAVQQVVSGMSR